MSYNDLDKFGYYQVADLKFYSKLDAAVAAQRLGTQVQWIYNDTVFESVDWTHEPAASLSELYRLRAQQIRDQYDYVVLWYSGGADCDNILNAFVDNNIRLDEAASVVNIEADTDPDGYLNGEIYNVVKPKIAKARLRQPDLKHSVIDLCQLTVDFFNNRSNRFDWVHTVSQYINPNYQARSQVVRNQRNWQDLMTAGKKVAFVWGIDKPKIINVGQQWVCVFRDVLDAAAITAYQINPLPGQYDEMFYWSPDLPQLIVKQAHVLKKFMQALDTTSALLSPKHIERNPSVIKNGKPYWLTTDGIHLALYPGWHPRPFQVKPHSLIFSPRDNWFFNLPDLDPAKTAWRNGLQYFWNTTPDWLKKDPRDMVKGIKVMTSRSYNIA